MAEPELEGGPDILEDAWPSAARVGDTQVRRAAFSGIAWDMATFLRAAWGDQDSAAQGKRELLAVCAAEPVTGWAAARWQGMRPGRVWPRSRTGRV